MKYLKAAALAGAVFAATAGPTLAYHGQELEKHAKVSLQTARRIALHAVPHGTIVDQELERESGGSGLRFSFDVRAGKTVHEVGVDANTGRVLENAVEGKNPD